MVDLERLDADQLRGVLMNTIHNNLIREEIWKAEFEGLRKENAALKEALGAHIIGILMRGTFRAVDGVEEEAESEGESETAEPEPKVLIVDGETKGYQA